MIEEVQLPDEIRPQFLNNVIGPIAHHMLKVSMPGYMDVAREVITDNNDDIWETFAVPALTEREVLEHLLGYVDLTLNKVGVVLLDIFFPTNKAQRDAAKIFLMRDRAKIFSESDVLTNASAFSQENASVFAAVEMIAFATQGLRVESYRDLIDFMSRPELPSVIRGLMAGARNFDFELRKSNGFSLEEIRRFVEGNEPLAFLDPNGMIVLNDKVKELARLHRKYYANSPSSITSRLDGLIMSEEEKEVVEGSGVASDKHSSGCPIKPLTFKQHAKELDKYGLGLTDAQIKILCSGDNPTAVAKPVNGHVEGNIFAIKEDAISLFLQVDIELLGYAIQRLRKELGKCETQKVAQLVAGKLDMIQAPSFPSRVLARV